MRPLRGFFAAVLMVGDEGFKKAPVGAGPYRSVSFNAGVELVLEAHEQYWRKVPSAKRLVFKSVADEATRLAMLKRGEADVVYWLCGGGAPGGSWGVPRPSVASCVAVTGVRGRGDRRGMALMSASLFETSPRFGIWSQRSRTDPEVTVEITPAGAVGASGRDHIRRGGLR